MKTRTRMDGKEIQRAPPLGIVEIGSKTEVVEGIRVMEQRLFYNVGGFMFCEVSVLNHIFHDLR